MGTPPARDLWRAAFRAPTPRAWWDACAIQARPLRDPSTVLACVIRLTDPQGGGQWRGAPRRPRWHRSRSMLAYPRPQCRWS
ncbi:hypothetical protein ACFPRL_28730 [Pseudoclavibacter helvolus]